jgi:hypothetical protein
LHPSYGQTRVREHLRAPVPQGGRTRSHEGQDPPHLSGLPHSSGLPNNSQ